MSRDAGMRPLIFGEVLFDRFPDGAAVLGGAPFNVAWHLQAFGLAPLMITRIGEDDLGDQVRQAMQQWGMDCAGLQTDPQHPTGSVEVSFVDHEPHYDIVPDRAYDFIAADALPALDGNWLLYHGSLALRNPVSAAALAAIKARAQARVFFDVNLRAPWWERQSVLQWSRQATWVKLNDDELQVLVPDLSEPVEQLNHLWAGEGEYIVLTRGKEGATVTMAEAGGVYTVRPNHGTQVVDTVGAGDAFCSVLILGLVRQWPIDLTLQRAQQFASAVVGLRGATTQDKAFYQGIMDSWKG